MISVEALLSRWEQGGCTEPRGPPCWFASQTLRVWSSAPSLSPLGGWSSLALCSLISAFGTGLHLPISGAPQGKPAQVLLFVSGTNDLSTRQ